MYQIITWGPYDAYQIIALAKTNKNLNELKEQFHQKYNIPWDDYYICNEDKDKIENKLKRNGFDTINFCDDLNFVNSFIQWLKYEHKVEFLLYKKIRFDEDPKYGNY
jgi:hypothetical protein